MSAAAVKPPGPTMQPTPQKVRPAPEPRESRAKGNGKSGPALRMIISIVIVWHFTAIFLAALCIPDSSPLVYDVAQKRPMQWYLDALYLNQGHSFFAPDVGPGHIIRYELFDQTGRSMGDGDLPSLKDHWPRLRYHRHLMLADQAPMGDGPNEQSWQRTYLEAYARQLLRDNPPAQAVRVRHYAHWPLYQELEVDARNPDIGRERAYQAFVQQMAQRGVNIDARGYQLLMEVTQRRSDLGPEPQPDQSSVWRSGPVETAGRWTGGPR
jgi:hypothetical protein